MRVRSESESEGGLQWDVENLISGFLGSCHLKNEGKICDAFSDGFKLVGKNYRGMDGTGSLPLGGFCKEIFILGEENALEFEAPI